MGKVVGRLVEGDRVGTTDIGAVVGSEVVSSVGPIVGVVVEEERHHSGSPSAILQKLVIKSRAPLVRAATLGNAIAHPTPKLTTPTSMSFSSKLGPPESP